MKTSTARLEQQVKTRRKHIRLMHSYDGITNYVRHLLKCQERDIIKIKERKHAVKPK